MNFHRNRCCRDKAIRVMGRIGASLLILLAASMPVAAGADASLDCEKNRNDLDKVKRELEKLGNTVSPAEYARKMAKLVSQLIADLQEVKKDSGKVVGAINKAKGQLKSIAGDLDEQKIVLPPGWDALDAKLDKLIEGITGRVKQFDKSSAGRAVKDVAEMEKLVGKAIAQLKSVKTGLDSVVALDKAQNGTAAEQIEALRYGFDQMKSMLGADEVPGMGEFLDAYSSAMEGMAKNVAAFEKEFNDKLAQADTALTGTGIDIYALYIRPKTPKEKLLARVKALKEQKARLERERAAAECDRPPVPADPCKDPNGEPEKMRAWLDGRTRELRGKYEASQQTYAERLAKLSQLSLSAPRDAPSAQESALNATSNQLQALEQAVKSNEPGAFGTPRQALAMAEALAAKLGVPVAARMTVLRDAGALLARLKPVLAKQQAQARQASAKTNAEAQAQWKQELDRYAGLVTAARDQRDAAKAAYDKAAADALAGETRAKWNKEQIQKFDDCFPSLGALRKSGSVRKPDPATLSIPTDKQSEGELPPKRAAMSFGDVPSLTMEIVPNWKMNYPLPGLLQIQIGVGKLVAAQGDANKAQEHVRNWGHSWAQEVIVEFDNGVTQSSKSSLSYGFTVPKGAKSVRRITVLYSDGSASGRTPLTWELKP